jgi:hypothetical protein
MRVFWETLTRPDHGLYVRRLGRERPRHHALRDQSAWLAPVLSSAAQRATSGLRRRRRPFQSVGQRADVVKA